MGGYPIFEFDRTFKNLFDTQGLSKKNPQIPKSINNHDCYYYEEVHNREHHNASVADRLRS